VTGGPGWLLYASAPSFPFPSFLLEVGPLINPANESEGWSTVNFPSGIWDGAPAEIEFGAF